MTTVPKNGTPPQPISQYDWDTDTHTHNTAAMDPAQLWRTAVALAATKARQAFPDSHGRIDKALELVLTGAVELLDNGHALVASQSAKGETTYTLTNGTCECVDFPKAPAQWCKHRLARAITVRATQLATELGQAASPVTLGAAALPAAPGQETGPQSGPVSLPAQFLVEIQGRQFVTFHGLLHLAHHQGLTSLKASFISVTAELALAHAVATFQDGRVFEESGDATPSNVNTRIRPHFPRMALTRAKARALRDALDLSYVCAEELGD